MRTGSKTLKLALLFLVFLFAAAFTLAAYTDTDKVVSALNKLFYVSTEDAVWTRPGLKVNIMDVKINADRKPVVTLQITDDQGVGLDREGKASPGAVSPRFILAYIPSNALQYVDYSTRVQKSPITGVSATQATSDSGGTFTDLGNGTYTYTFGTVLPANYDASATHTLGIYATRDLRSYGQSFYVANVTKNFVPNGAQVTKIREVVKTKACNSCHDPLAAHGETGRRDVEICILCHTPQTLDPDTGNTVDMKVMTHKIHMGSGLPSVKAGTPYKIIGNSQSVNDYSTVVFPMDVRNCEVCHKDSAQVKNWVNNPTRDTCGSCHDDVNFKTGLNHPGGPQPSDKYCANCHWEESDWEYDATIRGAHTVPYKSEQLRNPKAEIVSVTNLGPGLKPSVKLKITDRFGAVVKPSEMTRLTLRFAGPTGDYRWYNSESALKAPIGADGVISYDFTTVALPADAKGTFALEVEGYINAKLNPGTLKEVAQRDTINNVIQFYSVDGSPVVPRRTVVATANCEKCHDKLWFHGGNRNRAEACVLCHNPTGTDSRPAAKGEKESIDLKVMIHKIHSGENLTKDYSILGSDGTGTSFNDVLYPGDRRDCLQCHVSSSYTLPVAASATAVTWPANAWSPVMPTAAACLACHDSVDAAIHALTNTAPFGESCAVCHKESADAGISKVHAR